VNAVTVLLVRLVVCRVIFALRHLKQNYAKHVNKKKKKKKKKAKERKW
jgi:hypothetical protein